MRRAFRPTLATLALATLMAGCASSGSSSAYYATALTRISDARVNLHQQRLDAYIGCNRLSATAREVGTKLQVGEISATRMACQPGTDQREQMLIEFLERSPKLDKSGEMWILRDNVHAVVVSNDPAPGMPLAASDLPGGESSAPLTDKPLAEVAHATAVEAAPEAAPTGPGRQYRSSSGDADPLVRNWLPGLALIESNRQRTDLEAPWRHTRAHAVRKRGHWVWSPDRTHDNTRPVLNKEVLTDRRATQRDDDLDQGPPDDLGVLGTEGVYESSKTVETIRISRWRA